MATHTHVGPAGSFYGSLLASGKTNATQHCADFPASDESAILPPVLLSKYTEKRDARTGEVAASEAIKKTKPYQGLAGNALGNI